MNKMSELQSMADDDLDLINGGALSCGASLTVGRGLFAASVVCGAFGATQASSDFYQKSVGVLSSGCGGCD